MKAAPQRFSWSWVCPDCGDSILLASNKAETLSDFGAFVRRFHAELHAREDKR